MAEKKVVYEGEAVSLPPVRMMPGEVQSPETDWRNKTDQKRQQEDLELEGKVKRLIAYFKDEK